MVEIDWPIVPKYGENGELVRILLHDDWYDRLLPVYKYFSWAIGGIAISPPSSSALKKAGELIQSLVFEFQFHGWAFSLSLLYFLHKAAKKAVTVGKFIYKRVGGFGRMSFGKGSFGRSRTVIEEFPE